MSVCRSVRRLSAVAAPIVAVRPTPGASVVAVRA